MKSIALVATLAALPACFAIDDPNDGAECLKAAHCEAGETCVGGKCVIVCDLQMDCAEGRYCSPSGLCVPVDTTGTPPLLTAVRGNDAASESRIRDGLIVSGDNLVLAAFELRKNGKSYSLATRERSNTRVEVTFPLDIRSGEYLLLATNASGEASTGLALTLPEVTPELVLTKLNASTGTVSLDRLPMDLLVSEDELAPYPTRDELTGDMMVGRINQSSSTIAFERLPTGTIVTQAQMTSALAPYARSADLTGDALVGKINAAGTVGVVATNRLHSDVVVASELTTALQSYATTSSVSNVAQDLAEHVAQGAPGTWQTLPLDSRSFPMKGPSSSPAWSSFHSGPQFRVDDNRLCFRGVVQHNNEATILTSGHLAVLPSSAGLSFAGPVRSAIAASGELLAWWGDGEINFEGGSRPWIILGNTCFALNE